MSDLINRTDLLNKLKPRGISDEVWENCEIYKTVSQMPKVEFKAELEEIKTDIHLLSVTGITGKTLVRIESVDEIIDNHIKELNNV